MQVSPHRPRPQQRAQRRPPVSITYSPRTSARREPTGLRSRSPGRRWRPAPVSAQLHGRVAPTKRHRLSAPSTANASSSAHYDAFGASSARRQRAALPGCSSSRAFAKRRWQPVDPAAHAGRAAGSPRSPEVRFTPRVARRGCRAASDDLAGDDRLLTMPTQPGVSSGSCASSIRRRNFIASSATGQRIPASQRSALRRTRRPAGAAPPAPAFVQGVDWSDHLNYWNAGYDAVMVTDTAFLRNRNHHNAAADCLTTCAWRRSSRAHAAVVCGAVSDTSASSSARRRVDTSLRSPTTSGSTRATR